MNLLVKSPVWDDLREIGLRIAAENPDAADRFLTAARKSFDLLRRHPRIGRLRSFSVPGEMGDTCFLLYIAGQEEHHRKLSFQDEVRALLRRHEIEWDERYVWD